VKQSAPVSRRRIDSGSSPLPTLKEVSMLNRMRLYFMLPDVASATSTADELLLARIENRHLRFLARRGTKLGEKDRKSNRTTPGIRVRGTLVICALATSRPQKATSSPRKRRFLRRAVASLARPSTKKPRRGAP
jgi:hypothetical protein